MSPEEVGIPVPGRDIYGCNCYSSGENVYSERVMVEAWKSMFSWLSLVHSIEGFEEVEIQLAGEELPPLMVTEGRKVGDTDGVKE